MNKFVKFYFKYRQIMKKINNEIKCNQGKGYYF